ncbi:hypothetical protein [Intrasporangium calvum]|uniref:hypothetical protein n=1 Tax=Intrasporangium calvum TaxID=53358 RepID=UPI000DF5E64B|nr:hypothetical protein [Intrasporangium calvum]AXG14922.1 hypothetical protein DN585_17265 [Intrasporangium calvum]
MTHVHGVGPGTLLGARYAVTLRTSESRTHERWRAADHTLDREVVLVCFPVGSSVAAAALDAARRAAGIEDSRLTRVLDVGIDGDVAFIVEEPLTGAVPMSHLLQSGGLPAEEVRRLVGETASALERARHRGLHHLVLTPSSILRLPDGDVKVRGVATEAALTDADQVSDEHASRVDAVGLVKLIYAGLTARWPTGPGAASHARPVGLEPAPSLVGGVAAPSEIAVGIPNDLDLICRMTLNEDRGPISPGDLALQIAPWPSEPYSRLSPSARREGSGSATAAAADAAAADAAAAGSAAPVTESAGAAGGGAVAGGAVAGAAGGLSAAGAAAAGAASAIGDRVGSFARAAAERAARGAERLSGPDGDRFEGEDIALTDALDDAPPTRLEPPLPVFGGGPDRPSGAQSRIALAIVGALVLVALVIGINNVAKIGESDSSAQARPTVTVTRSTPAPSTTATGSSAPTTKTETPPPEPVRIIGGSSFDPQDDGEESPRQVPLAFDGDPGTAWKSRWYGTDTYNRSKEGVGLVLDLSAPTVVREVELTLPAAQDVTIYLTDEARLEGAQQIGRVTGTSGTVTIKAPRDIQAGSKLIIWVTRPAPDEAPNHHRAQIAEVVVR